MSERRNSQLSKIRILRIVVAKRRAVSEKDFDGRVLCGPEAKALDTCSKLNKQKFETIVVYSKGGRLIKEFEDIGIRVELFDTKSKLNLCEVLYLYRLIKIHKIDIVQTHGLRVDFFGFLASKLAGVPHIITRHVALSHHLIGKFRKRLYMGFDNRALKAAAKIITVSKIVEDDLVLHQGINRDKIVTIYNGVDLGKFSKVPPQITIKMREEFGIDSGKQVIGMIAQLTNWKGIHYFVRAMPLILERCPNAVFLLVGDGEERKSLETMVQTLGISSYVRFAGFRREIPEIISIMNISVLSSLREGLPNVLLESMAMCKPVVATDVGGVSELVINNKTGFLVQPRDSATLADAVVRLLLDEKKVREFGQAGRKYVEQKFSLPRMVEQYENLYTQLAEKHFKL
jgi:glycosyltransferase involved in cell wall biosynthesis